jgi:glycosyltransferase involved in cell wall biosynthesis
VTRRSLRIAVCSPTFFPVVGGAELGIHEIYKRLAEKHDVTVITPRKPEEVTAKHTMRDYEGARYRVWVVDPPRAVRAAFPRRPPTQKAVALMAGLGRLGRDRSIDVANFHFMIPNVPAMVAARRLYGIPVVLSLVGRRDVMGLLDRWRRLYGHLGVSQAQHVLPISSYYLGSNVVRNKAQVIPYGVDSAEFSPRRRDEQVRARLGVEPGRFILLTVQRLASIKRVDVLIRVMEKLVKRLPEAVLVVAGHGDEAGSLRSLATELGLEHQVKFTGYVTSQDLPDLFAAADLFVFHSMFETFGIVFAEAMASGLPIVAARTSCVPHVVAPENGTLVEPFDTEAFARAIVAFAEDPARRAEVAKGNRLRAEREFDWDRIANEYEEIMYRAARR